jgi:TrmH family RNA methyltransferase
MRVIVSRTHRAIKQLLALHTRAGRYEQKSFIAEGKRTCETLIKQSFPLLQIYIQGIPFSKKEHLPLSIAQEHEDFIRKYDLKDQQITLVPPSVMEKISGAHTPSGMLGVFQIPSTPSLDTLSTGVVLLNISDPGNLGTLIRTAAAMNIKNVVVIKGADVWSSKVIQASVGTIGQVTIYTATWEELISQKPSSLRLTALVAREGNNIEKASLSNTLLVVGNEAHGIASAYLAQCNERVTITMPGNTESLNAAIAGSIALYLMSARTSL